MFLWTSLAFIILALRLYTRGIIIRRLGADDCLMVAAFLSNRELTSRTEIKYGLGQPVNLATLITFIHAMYSTVACYNIAQTSYKLSIAIQSYRLFSTSMGKKIIKGLIGWISACGIMSISASFFYCSPVPKAWDDSIDGWCVDRSKLNYAIAGFNILNDIFLVSIPFPFLLKLQVAKKQRVVLLSVFACGVIVTIVSIIRMKALYDNLNGPINLQPVTGVDIGLLSDLEINVAIIGGSVPALKAFIGKIFFGQSIGGSSDRTHGNYGIASHSRKQTRNQSQVLGSQDGDEGAITGMGRTGDSSKMGGITVDQSIEMKACLADDTGIEKELITAPEGAFATSGRNANVKSGGGRKVTC
ncbi:putative integral membrane protein [Coniochaeta sp. 2T2.1]|nr:putative integral membrane protein [Coniochaeta sp. 2T2.1]